MAKKSAIKGSREHSETSELLTNLWITQLGLAGIPQRNIRSIVGCDMNRVARIVRHLKNGKKAV